MAERSQAEDMSQAAERFAAAMEEFSRQVERLGAVRGEPLSEAEAARLADEAVHEVRSELWAGRKPEQPALTPEEIQDWERRRKERRRREGS